MQPGSQNFGHTHPGREVRMDTNGSRVGYVIDYQAPADVAGQTAFISSEAEADDSGAILGD